MTALAAALALALLAPELPDAGPSDAGAGARRPDAGSADPDAEVIEQLEMLERLELLEHLELFGGPEPAKEAPAPDRHRQSSAGEGGGTRRRADLPQAEAQGPE